MSAVQPPPPPQVPDGMLTPPTQPKRSRKRFILLALLGLTLLCSLFLWVSYLTTRQPLTQVLPVAQVAARGVKPRYLFSIYGVAGPLSVAVTPDGNRIYAGDVDADRMVHVFNRDGKELAKFAPPNFNPALNAPVSIVLDTKGRVLVSDALSHVIYIFDSGGNYKGTIQSPSQEGWFPIGLRFNGANLLVADRMSGKNRVDSVTVDGKLTYSFGHSAKSEDEGAEGFSAPTMAVADAQGRIYVSDSNNMRVAVFDKGRNYLYDIPNLNLPEGMLVDDDQRLYIADAVGQTIRVYDVSGKRPESLFTFGDYGIGDGQFNYPNDIAIDDTGRLYIADRASNRIQVWTY